MSKKNEKEEDKNMSLALSKYADKIEVQDLLESGAIPGTIDTPEKLMTVLKTGDELGMAPMQTLNNINLIKGKTVLSAAALGAMVKDAGIEFIWTKDFVTEDKKQITEIEFEWISKVTGNPKTARFSVSWQEMERAGFTTKDNWQRMPKNMLRARCMAYGVRALFPEVLLRKGGGLYTEAEIVDAPSKTHGHEKYDTATDEQGNITVIPVEDVEIIEGDDSVQ